MILVRIVPVETTPKRNRCAAKTGETGIGLLSMRSWMLLLPPFGIAAERVILLSSRSTRK